MSISSSYFTSNVASYGGAIYLSYSNTNSAYSSEITITSTSFSNNYVNNDGGAICIEE